MNHCDVFCQHPTCWNNISKELKTPNKAFDTSLSSKSNEYINYQKLSRDYEASGFFFKLNLIFINLFFNFFFNQDLKPIGIKNLSNVLNEHLEDEYYDKFLSGETKRSLR